ncbi:MAG: molybdopterin dehydrogenase, partial [Deltaproteobacteria bacterium]
MVTAYRPATLQEALELRGRAELIPFAGGTDLMVKYHSWTGTLPKFPKDVLFLGHLKELRGIARRDQALHIGAGVTLSEVAAHPETPALLREAVLSIAAPGIRNVATLAGNICNASPAGDSICALTALGASVVLSSAAGTRTVPLTTFITGPGTTVLKPEELLTAVSVPLEEWTIQVFKKVGTRKANALAKLSFSALARVKN